MKKEPKSLLVVLGVMLVVGLVGIGCQNQLISGTYTVMEVEKVVGQVGSGVQLGSIDFDGTRTFTLMSEGEAGNSESAVEVDTGSYTAEENGLLHLDGGKADVEGKYNAGGSLIVMPRLLGAAGSVGFNVGIKSQPLMFKEGSWQIEGGESPPKRAMEGTWHMIGVVHEWEEGKEVVDTLFGELVLDQSQSFNTFRSRLWGGDGIRYNDSGQFHVEEDGSLRFEIDSFGVEFSASMNVDDTILIGNAASEGSALEQRWMVMAVKTDGEYLISMAGDQFSLYQYVEGVTGTNPALQEGSISFGPKFSYELSVGDTVERGIVSVQGSATFNLTPNPGTVGTRYLGFVDTAKEALVLAATGNQQDRVELVIGLNTPVQE